MISVGPLRVVCPGNQTVDSLEAMAQRNAVAKNYHESKIFFDPGSMEVTLIHPTEGTMPMIPDAQLPKGLKLLDLRGIAHWKIRAPSKGTGLRGWLKDQLGIIKTLLPKFTNTPLVSDFQLAKSDELSRLYRCLTQLTAAAIQDDILGEVDIQGVSRQLRHLNTIWTENEIKDTKDQGYGKKGFGGSKKKGRDAKQKGKGKSFKRKCHFCHATGHLKAECSKFKESKDAKKK